MASQSSTASASSSRKRVVTTADLKNKTCWICSEEEEEVEAQPSVNQSQHDNPAEEIGRKQQERAGSNAVSNSKAHGFVHPCHCTLVAHEKCLLQWIAVEKSKSTRSQNASVLCPSCKSPIILVKPILLTSFEILDSLTRYLVPIGTMSIIGSGILVASTAYGCLAIRLVMGKEAGRRILSGDWPLHFYFDIPLIPFGLIASKLRFFEKAIAWIPTVLAFPAAHIPLTSNRNGAALMIGSPQSHWTILGKLGTYRDGLEGRRYPPSPAVLALLVPWIRVFYIGFKRRITKLVLGRFLKKKNKRRTGNGAGTEANGNRNRNANGNGNGNGNGGEGQQGRRIRRERFIIVGNAEGNVNMLRDAGEDLEAEIDLPPGVEAVRDGRPEDLGLDHGPGNENQNQNLGQEQPQPLPQAQAGNQDREDEAEGEGLGEAVEIEEDEEERPQTIYISHQSLGRLCLGALSLPFIANLSGSLLGKLATKSRWLSKFLGMNWEEMIADRFSRKSASTSGGSGGSSSRIGALFSGGNGNGNGSSPRSKISMRRSEMAQATGFYNESWMGDFDDLDPVWYRNAIGAGLFILFKDAASLLYKYLQLRQRGRERVKDLPFDEGLIEGLDLRERN